RVIDDVLADAAAGLELGDLTSVTADLTLPALADGVAIAWSSDNPEVIAPSGKVTRPASGSAPEEVTLTATLTKGTAPLTRTFVVTVLPDVTPAEKAGWDAEHVALVAPDVVRGNITVPATGPLGSTIAWTSSDPA